MIKRVGISVFLILGLSMAAHGSLMQGLQDFFAPIVNDITGLANTIPGGTIVYQQSTSAKGPPGFYGLAPDGTWVSMGVTIPVGRGSWSGYHANDCDFTNTNTSFGNFAADPSCTFTQTLNSNFSTVTSYQVAGDNAPGIAFTPTRPGTFYVCATFSTTTNAALQTGFRLTDGTTVIKEVDDVNAAGTDAYAHHVCGIYNATTTSPVTLKLMGKISGSTLHIAGNATGTRSVLEWDIFQND